MTTGCEDGAVPADDRPNRPGRPRAVPDAAPARSPRDQVLDAAAALFVEHGFGATSTRAIADRVGIRQASLYYHFAGKDDVLVELLETSVRPSLEVARDLDDRVPGSVPAAVALAALVAFDVGTLAGTRTTSARCTCCRRCRANASRVPRRPPGATGRLRTPRHARGDARGRRHGRPAQLGGILIQLVETVIQLRRGGEVDDRDRAAITSSCLRVCGLDTDAVAEARRGAGALLAAVS